MKKRANKILCFAVLSCITAPVMAQTVDVTLQCGQTYTINSTVAATAGATYRWLENGSTVTGTAANYTVPKTKSVGVYTYIRQAKSEGCADWQNSNAFTVEVKNKNDDGVCIAGVMWAKYNVDVPGSFTASIDDPGKFYRYNSKIPYPTSGTCTWPDPPAEYALSWTPENDPCPDGWQLPSLSILSSLASNTTPTLMPAINGSVAVVCLTIKGSSAVCDSSSTRSLFVPKTGWRTHGSKCEYFGEIAMFHASNIILANGYFRIYSIRNGWYWYDAIPHALAARCIML